MTKKRMKPEAAIKVSRQTRRDNLKKLVGEGCRFAEQTELADALGVTDSYLSQMIGPNPRKPITEVTARKFEYKLRLPTGALDVVVTG
jgi:hypothetical protein